MFSGRFTSVPDADQELPSLRAPRERVRRRRPDDSPGSDPPPPDFADAPAFAVSFLAFDDSFFAASLALAFAASASIT